MTTWPRTTTLSGYELSQAGDGTAVSLTQDGCESEEQAERFSQNWQGMLDGLKKVAEAD